MDTRAYDLQGRLTSWTTGTIDSRTYGYDANGNITSINANTYGYDWLDRITNSNSALNFIWDANGNRQGDGSGWYGYSANSNRMANNPSGTVTLDAAGNTLAASGLTFEYNQAGRMAAARSSGTLLGQYAYSFDGHRAQKIVQGATTLFHYGADDNLLAETDAAGATLKEYVWDDQGRPLAQISGGVVTYLHPDHLGSPRIGTDSAKNVVWQWQDVAFGVAAPTGSATVALRYPGQYHEAETGLYQNWNRTYDKASGRYLESDPIGLSGGINSFAYVAGNPLSRVDVEGRFWWIPLYYAAVWTPRLVPLIGITAEILSGAPTPASEAAFGAGKALKTVAQELGTIQTFRNFRQAQNSLRIPGLELHHVVEQCQATKSGFAVSRLNSTDNFVYLPKSAHQQISAYYSTNVSATSVRFRNTLSGLSFEEQHEIGMSVIRGVLNGELK